MRIVVVGPGAIGCLFAGLLAEAKHSVLLLARNPDHAAEILKGGIRIEGIGGARTMQVRATADPATSAEEAELLMLCVKSYDTASAIEHALPLIGAETTVLTLQNGLGNIEQIAERVSSEQIIAGTTAHGANTTGPGHVRHAGSGETIIGAVDSGSRNRAQATANILSAAGIETKVTDDLQSTLWGKLIINAAINPLTAITNLPNGRLVEIEKHRETLQLATLEAAAVAKAMGIKLPYDDAVAAVEDVCKRTSENISSMLQDMRSRKRTEIQAISGIVVRESRKMHIAAPVNDYLLNKIEEMTKGLPEN